MCEDSAHVTPEAFQQRKQTVIPYMTQNPSLCFWTNSPVSASRLGPGVKPKIALWDDQSGFEMEVLWELAHWLTWQWPLHFCLSLKVTLLTRPPCLPSSSSSLPPAAVFPWSVQRLFLLRTLHLLHFIWLVSAQGSITSWLEFCLMPRAHVPLYRCIFRFSLVLFNICPDRSKWCPLEHFTYLPSPFPTHIQILALVETSLLSHT